MTPNKNVKKPPRYISISSQETKPIRFQNPVAQEIEKRRFCMFLVFARRRPSRMNPSQMSKMGEGGKISTINPGYCARISWSKIKVESIIDHQTTKPYAIRINNKRAN